MDNASSGIKTANKNDEGYNRGSFLTNTSVD